MKPRLARALSTAIAFVCGFAAFADPVPGLGLAVPGALFGPSFAAPTGLFATDPRAGAFLPSSPADLELPVFGFSSSMSVGSEGDSGIGVGASFFGALPGLWGTAFAVADFSAFRDGPAGHSAPFGASGLLGLAKEASDNVNVGVTLGGVVGEGDRVSSSVSAAFGLSVELSGVTAAASLLAIGSPFDPWSRYEPAIEWTPLAAVSTRVFDRNGLSLTAGLAVASPGFADLAVAAGASMGIGKALTLDLGWFWRLGETFAYLDNESDADLFVPRFFPSLALRFDGSSFMKFAGYGVSSSASYRPSGGGSSVVSLDASFSRGERDVFGPIVTILADDGWKLSPRLHSEVVVPIVVRDDSPIVAWELSLVDAAGRVVSRRGEGREPKKDQSSRLFSFVAAVPIPQSVSFPIDHTIADGLYRIRLWAQDARGNEGRAIERSVVLDGTAPLARVSVAARVFTPNGDGRNDTLEIVQSGSHESRWEGRFISASGAVVRSFVWTDGGPVSFWWDGTDERGNLVADGEYRYLLTSTDGAGNRTEIRSGAVVVDSSRPTVSLSVSPAAISPDSDGVLDSTIVSVDIPRVTGLNAWSVELIDASGRSRRIWQGSVARLDAYPQRIVFDGRDARAEYLEDGIYRFHAVLEYENGNRAFAESPPLRIDTSAPAGRVRSDTRTLALDQGGKATLYHDLSPNAMWRGIVVDSSGRPVRELRIPGSGEVVAEWNGLDESGVPVPDGLYRYFAEGTSSTAIVSATSPAEIRVFSGGAAVALVANRLVVSPVVDGTAIRFIPRLENRERIASYSLDIVAAGTGDPVRRFSGISLPPSSLVWDGRNDATLPCEDGRYLATLRVVYDGGTRTASESIAVIVDGTAPSVRISIAHDVFSPNGDGHKDSISLHIDASEESRWTGAVIDATGQAIAIREWTGRPPSNIVWDGRTAGGASAPDGLYRYRLSAEDSAGNVVSADSAQFRLDARVPAAVVSFDKTAFSPNGDGYADTVRLRAALAFADGLAEWSLRIVDGAGAEVSRFSGGTFRSEHEWNGRRADGTPVADGSYKAILQVSYGKGDSVRSESSAVVLDATPPRLGVNVSPLPFSPDDDGEADELEILLEVHDASELAGWSLNILDPEGFPFVYYSGKGAPAERIVWDGKDLEGTYVEAATDYTYKYIVRDALGNASTLTGRIPIDVFVLRDGDRLKIRISSITFAPNAASLSTGNLDYDARNRDVLDRIAVVLERFPQYRIRVEGHAVNLSGTEREERTELEPLSLARARSVLAALRDRGIAAARLEARGLGGREPIVPHGDVDARWRNRRVEFILVR